VKQRVEVGFPPAGRVQHGSGESLQEKIIESNAIKRLPSLDFVKPSPPNPHPNFETTIMRLTLILVLALLGVAMANPSPVASDEGLEVRPFLIALYDADRQSNL